MLFRVGGKSPLSAGHFSTMAASQNGSFPALFVALLFCGGAVVPSCGSDLSGLADKGDEASSAGDVDKLVVFKTWPGVSISLLSSFPEDVEMSDSCRELLQIFRQQYIDYAGCLVSAARPVKVCQSCFSTYVSLNDTYQNISSNQVRTLWLFLCVPVVRSQASVWRAAVS